MEDEMTIGKKVNQPFLITSKNILDLIRNKSSFIYLKNKYDCYEEFKIELDDSVEE